MKMLVTINKQTGAFSHPFFAPTIEEATHAMTKINPENLSDLQFHELFEFKNNSDIFRLRLGPENPISKQHLQSLITLNETKLDYLEAQHSDALEKKLDKATVLGLEYQIASLKFENAKYYLDEVVIGNSLSDT